MTAAKPMVAQAPALPLLRPATDTARSAVLVYEDAEAFPALATLLRHLDCIAVDGRNPHHLTDAMPTMRAALISDGVEAPLALCAGLPHDLPKILVATDASFEFRCAAARAGVDAIVKRPVDVNELSDWLEHFDSRMFIDPITVLLVDDHVLTAELHAAVLQRAGMKVRIINRPVDVLMAIEDGAPDLILMDVEMPGVNGIELAKMIRQSRETLSIPIAFLSAESDERRQMAARESGGDDFIQKPVDLKRLASLVRLRAGRARTMRSLIERDSLTGLLNHGRFKDRVATEIERSRRTGSVFSLAMVDLDHFKVVNDTHGHPAGDRVLRALARTMMGRLRVTDVMGRCGGEEFGILLLDTPPDAASAVVDELRLRFGAIVFEETAGPFSVTFSAGIAGSTDRDLPRLFAAADDALYRAKRAGRNRIAMPPAPGRRTGPSNVAGKAI